MIENKNDADTLYRVNDDGTIRKATKKEQKEYNDNRIVILTDENGFMSYVSGKEARERIEAFNRYNKRK